MSLGNTLYYFDYSTRLINCTQLLTGMQKENLELLLRNPKEIVDYRKRLGKSVGVSFIAHALLLPALSIPILRSHYHEDSNNEAREVAMVQLTHAPESQKSYNKSLSESQGADNKYSSENSDGTPEIFSPNPRAILGPQAQSANPDKKMDGAILRDNTINLDFEERLSDTILGGKDLNALFTQQNPLGKENIMSYSEFFLAYVGNYLKLNLDYSLVGQKNVDANKIDLRMSFLATIGDDGQIILLQYEYLPNLNKLEQAIFNHVYGKLKLMPKKFIPPSKANLKSPNKQLFEYMLSFKTLGDIDMPYGGKFKYLPMSR